MSQQRKGSRLSRMLSPQPSLSSRHTLYFPSTKSHSDGNLVLPHTVEAGDPYYIGDAYDSYPSPCAQEWELLDGVKRPYLEHVKNVSAAWPHLRYLADWMQVTTSPLKWKFIKSRESIIRQERASRTKVAVADLSESTGSSIQIATSVSELETILNEQTTVKHPDTHRLYIVEDLSRDVIELLGHRLDIDPLLFREQISDYLWYNTRDAWVELPDLLKVANERPFFHLRYLQPRYFRTQPSFVQATKQAGMFNVLRRVDSDRYHQTIWDEAEHCVGLVRSRTSFWWKPAVPGERGVTGVLLLDPTISEGFPLWDGYRNFQLTPSISSSGPFKPPPNGTLFDAVLHWYQQMLATKASEVAADPRAMLIPVSHIICAQWLSVCRYVAVRLTQVEWELEEPEFRRDPNGIDASLSKLHPLRRSVPMYLEMVRETISRLFPDNVPLSEGVKSLKPDFVRAEKSIEELQERIERIFSGATAIISIEDSRREMNLNVYLGRLSFIAVLFAPLSFITSLFSMVPDLGQLSQTFWIYFVTAVPFTALGFLIVDFSRILNWATGFWKGDKNQSRGTPQFTMNRKTS